MYWWEKQTQVAEPPPKIDAGVGDFLSGLKEQGKQGYQVTTAYNSWRTNFLKEHFGESKVGYKIAEVQDPDLLNWYNEQETLAEQQEGEWKSSVDTARAEELKRLEEKYPNRPSYDVQRMSSITIAEKRAILDTYPKDHPTYERLHKLEEELREARAKEPEKVPETKLNVYDVETTRGIVQIISDNERTVRDKALKQFRADFADVDKPVIKTGEITVIGDKGTGTWIAQQRANDGRLIPNEVIAQSPEGWDVISPEVHEEPAPKEELVPAEAFEGAEAKGATSAIEIPEEGVYIAEGIKVMPDYTVYSDDDPSKSVGTIDPETGEFIEAQAGFGEKVKSVLSSIWKGIPRINPYYWMSPQEQQMADYKNQLVEWAKSQGIENPEEYVNNLMEKKTGEVTMGAVSEEELAEYKKVPPPTPSWAYTTSWSLEGYTKGEQFIGDWLVPMLTLALLPSAGAVRTALQSAAQAGGVAGTAAQVGRVVLKPVEVYEQGISALLRLPAKAISTGTRKALETYINNNAKYIRLIATQREYASLSVKGKILYKLFNFHNRYMTEQAATVLKAQAAARSGVASTADEGIAATTQTMDNIVAAVQSGKELTTTSISALIAKNTPQAFVTGLTDIVAGKVVAGVSEGVTPKVTPVTPEVAPNILADIGARIAEINTQLKAHPYSAKLQQELATLTAQRDVAGETPQVIRRYLEEVEADLGIRAMPYQGRTGRRGIKLARHPELPRPLKPFTANQLQEMRSVYQEALNLAEAETVTGVIPEGEVTVEGLIFTEPKEIPSSVAPEVANLITRRAEIQSLLAEPAKNLPEGVTKVALRKELNEISQQLVPSEKNLRQSIMATVKIKGISETQYRQLFKKVSGSRYLTNIGYENLNKVLATVQRARPVTIGQKKVITPKTEQEIQDVKQALIGEDKLNQADYDAILRMLKLSTDRYMDKTAFITETQGRNIIKAMKRKSHMGYAFVEQRINELVDSIKPPDEPPKIITSESLKQPFGAKFIDKIQAFTIRSYRMERILYRLDGYEDKGLWQDTFYKPVNEATSARLGEVIEWQDKFLQFAKDNNINIGKLFTTKEDFDGVILTSAEKIGVYLHSLNPDNLRHLRVGNKFSDDLIKRIVDSLTPEEKATATFLQDYFAQSGTPVAETFRYMTGKDLELVEKYFPIKIDWRADPEIDWWQLVSLADSRQFMAKWASSMIPKGFLSARTHEAIQAVSLDAMSIWWNHLELTAHYKNFAPIINDLQLIMQNPKFKYTLQNTQGRHLHQVLNKWITQVADVNPLRATNYAEQMMRTLRVNAVTAVLGINLTTALKQFPSFVAGMSEAGVIPVLRGLGTFLSHPKETTQLMKQLSPQIYARTMEREIAEARLKASLEKKLTRKLAPREAFMLLTTSMDKLAVNSLWRGAFDEYLRNHPNEIQEAAEYASRVIRRTQPFFSVKDLAEYYRSGEFMKVLTIFTNQLNQYWNMARFEMFGKFGAKPGAKGFGELVKKLMLGIVIPSIMIGIITRARLYKDKEDAVDKTKDDVVRTMLSGFPIFGQWLSAGFQGWSEGQGLISTELFSQLQSFIYNLNQAEWDKVKLQIPEMAGYILGMPVAQPKRTIQGIIDFLQGETDDWLRLIYSEYTRDSAFRELMEGWQKDFNAYYEQPSPRYDYREANPEVDAKLFISNKVSTLQSDEARNIALRLIQENNIDIRRINAYEKIFGEEAETKEQPSAKPPEEQPGGYWWEK